MEETLLDQVRDGAARGKVRIQRQPGVRPLISPVHPIGDVLSDAGIMNVNETARKVPIVVNQPIPNPKDIHVLYLSSRTRLGDASVVTAGTDSACRYGRRTG